MKFFILYNTVMIWGFFKACKMRNEKACYGICMAVAMQLIDPPLKIPLEFILIGLSLLGAIVLFYKWKVKKIDDSLIFFSALFLIFGFAFLIFWSLKQDRGLFWLEPVARAVNRLNHIT